MEENELNFGEAITLTAFWETCEYYLNNHIEDDVEKNIFSFVVDRYVSIYKKNGMWYVGTPSEKKEFSSCYNACEEILRDAALTDEQEMELLRIFANNMKKGYSYVELEEKSKVFKKCII